MPKENRGYLGKNKFKKSEKHPDYTGVLDVDGTEFQLSAWIEDSKQEEGQKYLSLSVRKKEEQPEQSDPVGNVPDVPF